jgi:hypothetical protein
MPKVVITMPAYHAGETLSKTVRDIPTDVADELILVDDASTDSTAEITGRSGYPSRLGQRLLGVIGGHGDDDLGHGSP